jgi:NAD(P)H dehydrogenase (quinone)
MGKGGGCAPSKKQKEAVATGNTTATPSASRETPATSKDTVDAADSTVAVEKLPDQSLKVFIVFYSMYGHVESLAKRMKKGVDGTDGVEAVLYRVAETLPQEVLDKMHAPPKDESIPVMLLYICGFMNSMFLNCSYFYLNFCFYQNEPKIYVNQCIIERKS